MVLFVSVICAVLSVVLNSMSVVGLIPLYFLCNPSISMLVSMNGCVILCNWCSMLSSVSSSVSSLYGILLRHSHGLVSVVFSGKCMYGLRPNMCCGSACFRSELRVCASVGVMTIPPFFKNVMVCILSLYFVFMY